jgi:hypothetical protein
MRNFIAANGGKTSQWASLSSNQVIRSTIDNKLIDARERERKQ